MGVQANLGFQDNKPQSDADLALSSGTNSAHIVGACSAQTQSLEPKRSSLVGL